MKNKKIMSYSELVKDTKERREDNYILKIGLILLIILFLITFIILVTIDKEQTNNKKVLSHISTSCFGVCELSKSKVYDYGLLSNNDLGVCLCTNGRVHIIPNQLNKSQEE